jgi:hypothetical protein
MCVTVREYNDDFDLNARLLFPLGNNQGIPAAMDGIIPAQEHTANRRGPRAGGREVGVSALTRRGNGPHAEPRSTRRKARAGRASLRPPTKSNPEKSEV